MANPPLIVNKQPLEGDVDVDALSPIKFGVRDTDYRVDLTSMRAALMYARAVYTPFVLPDSDSALTSEDISTTFSMFNDAAGATLPGTPADQTIETVGSDTVYRIERTTDPQEGFRYIEDVAGVGQVYCGEVQLTLLVTGSGSYSYVTYADFTGVLIGFILWPKNTGLFLLFRDDGVTKRISIVGPSIDGVGTRTVVQTVVFDWLADAYTYRIVWSDSQFFKKIVVLAESSDKTTEVLLADLDPDTLNEFLPSVVLGNSSAESPPQRVTLVFGVDSPNFGEQIDVYKATLYRFGVVALVNGVRTPRVSVDCSAVDALLLAPGIEDEWLLEGEGTLSTVTSTLQLSRSPTLLSSNLLQLRREEPDLSRQEWFLVASLLAEESEHVSSYNSGMGITIRDGVYEHRVRLLDDFLTKDIGVFIGGPTDAIGDTDNYQVAAEPSDWASTASIIVLGSASRNYVRAWLNIDEGVSIETATYAPGLVSTDTEIAVGFLDSDIEYYGNFRLLYLRLFPNGVFYEAEDGVGSYPDDQGWTRTFFGATRTQTGRLSLVSMLNQYDIYSIVPSTYETNAGASLLLKAKVTGWVNSSGINTPRKEIGPIAAIVVDPSVGSPEAVQLCFTQELGVDGRKFVYLPALPGDLGDVLAQTERGRLISAEVNFAEDHVYLLELRPFTHVRLYVDYAIEAAIDIPWGSSDSVFRAVPANVPGGAVIAFGSLEGTSGVSLELPFVRASTGTGYDFAMTLSIPEQDLQDYVYGSKADVFIDFEDEDP